MGEVIRMRWSRWGVAALASTSVAAVIVGAAVTFGAHHGGSGHAVRAGAGDPTGISACTAITDQARDYGSVSGLIRGETSTGSEVAAWQEQRDAPDITGIVSPLRSGSGSGSSGSGSLLDATVTVCVFRGEFDTPTGPPPLDGPLPARHDTLTLLLLPDGTTVMDSSGYENRGGADTPALWRARIGGSGG